jgi:hypothetical protein
MASSNSRRIAMPESNSGWKNWGDHPIVVVIGLMAAIIAIISFFVAKENKQSEPQQSDPPKHSEVQSNSKVQQPVATPTGPPDIDVPILQEDDLFSAGYGSDSGCYAEGHTHNVTVIKPGQEDLADSEDPFFILRDERNLQDKYYIEHPSSAVASWIPSIMISERRLKIKYAQCGSGGYKFLTYIEVLNRSK